MYMHETEFEPALTRVVHFDSLIYAIDKIIETRGIIVHGLTHRRGTDRLELIVKTRESLKILVDRGKFFSIFIRFIHS